MPSHRLKRPTAANWVRFIGLCLAVGTIITSEVAAAGRGYYRAAVIEHTPKPQSSSDEKNLQEMILQYESYIYKAQNEEADIVVFPEAGLFGSKFSISHFIPDPLLNVVPADSTACDDYVRLLSEYARKYSVYVAVNLLEKFTLSGGSLAKYITNVVFDRKGAVVAKYRKFHLFGEPVNKTNEIKPSYFDSDFGVRFGQLMGVDILYKEPASTLMEECNVTNFIYSVQWFSELPFLTSVQAQWMWSVGNNVNLLAAGLNNLKLGSAGSGIYRGTNARIGSLYTFNDVAGGAMIIANVTTGPPKIDYSNVNDYAVKHLRGNEQFPLRNQEGLELMANKDIDLSLGRFISHDLYSTSFMKQICHGSLCCSFKLWVRYRANAANFQYKAVVFDGIRTSTHRETKLVQGVQICGIVLCSNKKINSCGSPALGGRLPNAITSPKSSINFTSIEISGNFTNNDSKVMPNVLLFPIIPAKPTNQLIGDYGEFLFDPRLVNFNNNANEDIATLQLVPNKKIITCAIFSRLFSRDARYVVNYTDLDRMGKGIAFKPQIPSFVVVLLPIVTLIIISFFDNYEGISLKY